MLCFFIDNIFVEFGGLVVRQTIGIPMNANWAPLLALRQTFVKVFSRINIEH